MKVSLGCDHGGFDAINSVVKYLESKSISCDYVGTFSTDSCDYPDFANKVCEKVASKEVDFGILICGTGIGMSIAANKIKGIRCAHVNDAFSAEYTRRHNDSNVIALGARIATADEIVKYINIFLNTEFEGGRHANRVNKITEIENKYFKW